MDKVRSAGESYLLHEMFAWICPLLLAKIFVSGKEVLVLIRTKLFKLGNNKVEKISVLNDSSSVVENIPCHVPSRKLDQPHIYRESFVPYNSKYNRVVIGFKEEKKHPTGINTFQESAFRCIKELIGKKRMRRNKFGPLGTHQLELILHKEVPESQLQELLDAANQTPLEQRPDRF